MYYITCLTLAEEKFAYCVLEMESGYEVARYDTYLEAIEHIIYS